MYNICTWPLTLYQLEIKSLEYFIGIGIAEYLLNPSTHSNQLGISSLFLCKMGTFLNPSFSFLLSLFPPPFFLFSLILFFPSFASY